MSKVLFEIGKTYEARSAYDHECVYTITVTGRTEKMLVYTYSMDSDTRRSKIRTDVNSEYVMPDRYSMAPVFRATRLHQPKEAQPEQPKAKIIPFPQKITEFDRISNDEGCDIRKGHYVIGNWGTPYPEERGVILGITRDPSLGHGNDIVVVIMWLADGGRPTSKLSFTTPDNIHRKGWRSPNGSPIGVFLEE